jgi:hypothetical protein
MAPPPSPCRPGKQRLRCPVVAGSRDSHDVLVVDNIWEANAVPGYHIWVSDLSGT